MARSCGMGMEGESNWWLNPPELMEWIEMNDIGHGADRDGWLSPPESWKTEGHELFRYVPIE
jgi:hypothetical protein